MMHGVPMEVSMSMQVQQAPAMPPQGWDPVIMNRRAAFDVFDVAADGTINSFELSMALMGCDDVREAVYVTGIRQLRDAEVQDAMDKVHLEPGGLVTFQEFNQVCEILVHSLAPRKLLEEQRASARAYLENDEVAAARAGSPQSPRGDAAIITSTEHHTELGVVQKAFYSFDIDRSGTVSGHEVPRMLRLVGIGPKNNDKAAWAAFEHQWHLALQSIYPPKDPTELLNVFDFHDMCMVLNPNLIRELPERPPPPPPPVESLSLDELARLEREERQRRAEEERIRKEEEERIAQATLHVKAPSGRIFCLLETSRDDSVAEIMRRIEDIEGVPVAQQRLVAQGWEMSPKQNLRDYGVKIGHPQRHKATTVTLLVRESPQQDEKRNPVGPLHVRSCFGDTYTINAKADDAVSEVMRRIEEVSGIPHMQQRLVGNGREMCVYERLREAGVFPGDTVFLLTRGS
eukprot:TRINITY_DN18349_c0_g1_i1.p1 TRINITY_DN18349_c0_g1~~TRINITY_DN18349_c0_g1_i1.p1  ORF type:complete len:459 (+),score=125.05 TRINITY_DN18349_c0_g1_i1:161-1537(+)